MGYSKFVIPFAVKPFWVACGAMALVFAACADDNGVFVGTSTEPNTVALGSSSSTVYSSDSEQFGGPRLCRVADMQKASADCDWFAEMWNPESGYRVRTGFDNGTNTSGIWFLVLDSTKLLIPSVEWPAEVSDVYDSLSFSNVIDACDGAVCGTAHFNVVDDGIKHDVDELTEDDVRPSVDIVFSMAGKNATGKFDEVDVSEWGGICIGYASSGLMNVVLDFGDSVENALDGILYEALLFRSSKPSMISEPRYREECLAWSDFKPSTGRLYHPLVDEEPAVSIEESLKHLVSIRFRFRSSYDKSTESFKIVRLGRYAAALNKQNYNEDSLSIVDENCGTPVAVESFCECNYTDSVAKYYSFDLAFAKAEDMLKSKADAGYCLGAVKMRMMMLEMLDLTPGVRTCDNAMTKILQCADKSYRISREFADVKSVYDKSVENYATIKAQEIVMLTDSCMMSSYRVPNTSPAEYVTSDLWYAGYTYAHVYTDAYSRKVLRGADAGEFFARTDSLEGGKSNIVWPVEIPYSDGRDFFTQVKDACRGICGVAHFGQGESSDAPFVEIGFNVEGHDSSGKYYAMDVSNWKGICAQYYSGVPIALTLDLGDSVNRDLGMDLPFVTLPKADSVSNFVCFEWEDFKQSGSGKLSASYKYDITGENAAKQVVKVIFKMQGTSGSESSFRIMAISSKRPNSTDWGEETKSSSSSAVAMLPIFCKTETEDNCEYGTMTDARDGQTYKTVKVGEQWWMARNLNYADSVKTPVLTNHIWCFTYQRENCDEIGLHYTWHAAKEACPDGWHLPSNEEWKKLIDTVGGEAVAGKILRSQAGWDAGVNGSNGMDAVGFSILPAGYRIAVAFVFTTMLNGFWSSSEYDVNKAGFMGLNYLDDSAKILDMQTDKINAYPVRCIKD